jgi:hypothetical protein
MRFPALQWLAFRSVDEFLKVLQQFIAQCLYFVHPFKLGKVRFKPLKLNQGLALLMD